MARLGKRFWAIALHLGVVLSSAGAAGAEGGGQAGGGQAGGEPLPEVHRVIEIYDADVVVDLSLSSGAKVGSVIELWRPLELEHPVTGATIADEFLIGTLRLTQVRATLSLARPIGKLERAPEAGDIVVLRQRGKEPRAPSTVSAVPVGAPSPSTPPAPPSAAPLVTAPPRDPEADAVSRVLDEVKGKGARARILAYEKYVREKPNGRYAAVLWEEAQKLRRLVTLEAEATGDGALLVTFLAPDQALGGSPLSIGVELVEAPGALLHSRAAAEVAYTTTPMTKAGDGYFTAVIPGGRMKAPTVEYFIEAVNADGTAVAAAGNARAPLELDVVNPPAPKAPPRHGAIASISTDYANWNLEEHNDYVLQTEGFVGMRFTDVGLRAGRTGFGVYRGRGGSLEELDEQNLEGREVGLTYGYLEAEAGITPFVGIIGRTTIGLQRTGVAGGFQLHLRLGSDLGTNLTLGGEVLGTVGLRGITQLELATFPKFPILLRTEVTNQPAGSTAHGRSTSGADASTEQGAIGVRGIAQAGYRIVPQLTVAVRVSYQGRTIHHAGPGIGGGVTTAW